MPDLAAELEREREKASDYMNRWQRAQADLSNYKRRAEQEREQERKFALAPLFLELHSLGLTNSLAGLALFYTTFNLPIGVFVMRNSFLQVPGEKSHGQCRGHCDDPKPLPMPHRFVCQCNPRHPCD